VRFPNCRAALAALALLPAAVLADYVPPRNLAPDTAAIQLDKSFRDDAWLVYGYDIDPTGAVVNPRIISSNGVAAVEQAVLEKVSAMRFAPATRDGRAVKATADPVIFTWVLDLPRDMSDGFREQWQTAWALFREGNLADASALAEKLGSTPGRNAFEEVKYRILAASLASRGGDWGAELRHLQRASEFQQLARNNRFKNRYIDPDQYLLILERIQALQLERMMLADAGDTLALIRELDPDSQVARRAAASYAEVEGRFNALPEVTTPGELAPVYPGGPGVWKTGLSRSSFSLGDVQGRVSAVYLVCDGRDTRLAYPSQAPWSTPAGATGCKIDLVGDVGTRVVLNQLAN
jgi:TonB family protein